MVPTTFLNAKDDPNMKWHCLNCNYELYEHSIQNMLEKIGQQLNSMHKGDIETCRQFIKTNEKYLTQNHYYLTDVKLALINLLGQIDKNRISNEDLEEKIKLGQEILEIILKVCPGKKNYCLICSTMNF